MRHLVLTVRSHPQPWGSGLSCALCSCVVLFTAAIPPKARPSDFSPRNRKLLAPFLGEVGGFAVSSETHYTQTPHKSHRASSFGGEGGVVSVLRCIVRRNHGSVLPADSQAGTQLEGLQDTARRHNQRTVSLKTWNFLSSHAVALLDQVCIPRGLS